MSEQKDAKAGLRKINRIEDKNKIDIPPEFETLSNFNGWISSARILLPFVALIVITPILWQYISPYATIPIWVLLGVLAYKLTIVMHDCAHNTLFANRKLNKLIGQFCGYILVSDFKTFRHLHWQHHMNYGCDEDPQGQDYLDLGETSKIGLIWHLLKPLFGFNLFKLFSFSEGGEVKIVRSNQVAKRVVAKLPSLAIHLLILVVALV